MQNQPIITPAAVTIALAENPRPTSFGPNVAAAIQSTCGREFDASAIVEGVPFIERREAVCAWVEVVGGDLADSEGNPLLPELPAVA